jgi:hypothetical protein
MINNYHTDIIKKLAGMLNQKPQEIILFCRNNQIAYVDLLEFCYRVHRLPKPLECAKIRDKGQNYINSL